MPHIMTAVQRQQLFLGETTFLTASVKSKFSNSLPSCKLGQNWTLCQHHPCLGRFQDSRLGLALPDKSGLCIYA
jgi:hypothetical protein